jgi:hypothetical protein
MGRTACPEPQCLYKGALYLYFYILWIVTARVAYFQRKPQLSIFSSYPDGSPSQLIRISGVLLYCTWLFKMIVGVLATCHTQYTSFPRCNPMWFLSMSLRQGSGLCSSSSLTCPGTEGCYMLQTVWNELEYRVDVCRITKGAHTEHL